MAARELQNNAAALPPPVQLAFAWSPAEHRLVHIGEARAGQAYLHPDPALRWPLIPRKGLLRRHHFAHHPSVSATAQAAAAAAGGEGLRHLNYKLAIAHRLQHGGDLALTWRCPGCDRREHATLRTLMAFDTAAWEVAWQGLRLDVGLLQAKKTVGAIEVRDAHAIDPAKAAAFAAAAANPRQPFRAFELPALALPLKPPLRVERQFPMPLCAACQTRRERWLAWARNNRPATNFSGWLELPAGEQSCVRLGGGWATRAANGEVLQPVVCWLELGLRRDREIQIAALTVHRRRGRLRWRELILRAPQGLPTTELDYQLTQAAGEFAAAAVKYRQRLARAAADQLHRWLQEATSPAAEVASGSPAPPIAAPAADAAAAAVVAAPTPAPLPPTVAPTVPTAALPRRARQRVAAWFDRLAHAAADWLDRDSRA